MENNDKIRYISIIFGAILLLVGCIAIYIKIQDSKEKLLWSNEAYSDDIYNVTLNGDKLYINDELIAENIDKYIDVTLGADICEGNRYLVFLMKDATISSLSIDSLSCANEISYEENIGGYKKITDIYSKLKSEENLYEPAFYDVYAVDHIGNEYFITDYIDITY